MKQLTKKQRAEIYLKAAEIVLVDTKHDRGCCWAIHRSTKDKNLQSYYAEGRKVFYPEFYLLIGDSVYSNWTPKDRSIVMLLCYEMCQP